MGWVPSFFENSRFRLRVGFWVWTRLGETGLTPGRSRFGPEQVPERSQNGPELEWFWTPDLRETREEGTHPVHPAGHELKSTDWSTRLGSVPTC